MKIVEPTQLDAAGIKASGIQPDPKQSHKGTVVHRRWDGEKAAAIAAAGFFDIDVQRVVDEGDIPANFAIVTTIEMPGDADGYTQVLNRVAIKPVIPVAI